MRLVRIAFAVAVGVCLPHVVRAEVVTTSVEFSVTIQNRTPIPCSGIGSGPATVRGTLVSPAETPSGVTLYLHGLGFGKWFWTFSTPTITDLDYAEKLAELGHASVVIDRLGYGDSPLANGNESCLGVQADVAKQIADQLRSAPFGFTKVALAGHSAGGAITQVAGYSFPDAFDGLIVMSYADQGASPDTLVAFLQAGGECMSSATGYSHFGQTAEDFDHLMFNTPRAGTGQLPLVDSGPTADQAVIDAATPLRNEDPCGDDNSFPQEIVLSQVLLTTIQKPLLLVCGDEDAVFPRPACDLQMLHFAADRDFEFKSITGAGHALTLGKTAAAFRAAVADWLGSHGF